METRRAWIRRAGAVCALASAAPVLGGCSNTYFGRLATLHGPDVDDYLQLPRRAVPTGRPVWEIPLAGDPQWISRSPVQLGRQLIGTSAALDAFLEAHATRAFLVLKDGAEVDARFYAGAEQSSLHKTFSMSKSVLSAMFGIAEAEGLIDANDPLGKHVDQLESKELADVPLQMLLDTVAGFVYRRGVLPWQEQPRMYYTTDVRAYVREARLSGTPGARFVQEDLSPLLVGVALEQALLAAGRAATLSSYASEVLWAPMGCEADAQWVLDRTGAGFEKVESGLVTRARDLARFGLLFLQGGSVGGRQIVPAAWVDRCMTAPAQGAPNRFVEGFHSNLWWGRFASGRARPDVYANGHFGQRIMISPDKGLVLVRLGSDTGGVDWTSVLGAMADAW